MSTKPEALSVGLDALVGQCDICGNITAIDLDATPENEKAMQYPDRTILRMPRDEALSLWRAHPKRCDHKALIAELRAKLTPNAKLSGVSAAQENSDE